MSWVWLTAASFQFYIDVTPQESPPRFLFPYLIESFFKHSVILLAECHLILWIKLAVLARVGHALLLYICYVSGSSAWCYRDVLRREILFFSIILSNAEHQDLCLTYQLHMDYVTCLCSDLFLFSIWCSWYRVFLSYKSYNLEEPTLISSGALWKISRVRLTCGDRAFQHTLRKNCFWAHVAARYSLHGQQSTYSTSSLTFLSQSCWPDTLLALLMYHLRSGVS